MSTIQETVQSSLSNAGYGGYQQYAEPVVTALVNREQECVGRLIQFTQEQGMDPEGVRATLADCGFHMPAAQVTEATAAPVAEGDIATVLAQINQTLAGLAGFARQHGYQG